MGSGSFSSAAQSSSTPPPPASARASRQVHACDHCLRSPDAPAQSLDDGAKSEFFPFAPDASGSLDMSFNTSFAGLSSLARHQAPGGVAEGVLKKWGAAADIAEAERLVGAWNLHVTCTNSLTAICPTRTHLLSLVVSSAAPFMQEFEAMERLAVCVHR